MRFASTAVAAAVVVTACVLGLAQPSRAEFTPAADFSLTLTSQRPASPTAATVSIHFKNPDQPGTKPSPQRKVIITVPSGTVVNGAAVPACHASDLQLMLLGPAACPPGTQVGSGSVTLLSGCGPPLDPITDDVAIFNGGDGLLELFTNTATGARTAVGHRSYTAPNVLTEAAGPQPGCPPPGGESAVTQLDYRFDDRRGASNTPFITTPPSCPARGSWMSQLSFVTADTHTYNTQALTPCSSAVRDHPTKKSRTSRPSHRPKSHRQRHRQHPQRTVDPRFTG